MLPDYYQILGAQASDTFDTIKTAFRKKAMQCHPDRGGSVEAMKEINEAWEILSNPEKRRIYDAVRANPNNPDTVRSATENTQDAKQRSDDFPRKWADFEEFLNKVTEDFQRAKYGQQKMGAFQVPTVDNSISEGVFVIVGALLVGCVVGIPVYNWLEGTQLNKAKSHGVTMPVLALGACGLVGAWIGAQLHKAASDELKKSTSAKPGATTPEPDKTEYRIFTCGKCQQKLRVPRMNAKLAVTCSKCGDKFDVL